jgi:hypothetical protein
VKIGVDVLDTTTGITMEEIESKRINYEQSIAYLKKPYPSVYDLQFLQENMFVIRPLCQLP